MDKKKKSVVPEVVEAEAGEGDASDEEDTSDADMEKDCGIVASMPGQSTDQKKPDTSLVDAISTLKKHTDNIVRESSGIADGFVSIGRELAQVRDDQATLRLCGYSDVYDYAEKVFGFRSTSTKNFMAVAEKFGKGDTIDSKYEDFSFTQLVELLPVADHIESYKPEMTVREIRDKKILEKAKQSAEALHAYYRYKVGQQLSFLESFSIVDAPADKPNVYPKHGPDAFAFRGVYKGANVSGLVYMAGDSVCTDGLKIGKFSFWIYPFEIDPAKLHDVYLKELEEAYQSNVAAGKAEEEAAKAPEQKPEWQLWYEMDESDRVRSFTKEGLLDPKLHAFFFDDEFEQRDGVNDAVSWDGAEIGLMIVITLEDPKADEPKIAEVMYAWMYKDNRHIATAWEAYPHEQGEAKLNSLLCLVDDWCRNKIDSGLGVKGDRS